MSQPEQEWIEIEFETLDLNDKRLDKRAEKIVRDFSAKPTASIPEFSESWEATKAVYDFCANEKVAAAQIVQAQRQATQARMKAYAFVLGLQDTTEINLSHYPATEGTGTLSSGYSQGFLAHSTFVVTAEGLPLGLLAQECWAREEAVSAHSKAQVARPIEAKESYKWLKALNESTAELPATTQMLVVSDRESDLMEYFLHLRPSQVELLLRSSQERRIEGSEWLLWHTVKRGPVQGLITVEVDAKPPQPARTATCQVRFQPVTVRPPKNRPASLPTLKSVKLWAILLEEMDVPEGVKPLAWRLLTTMAVTTFDDACRMIEFYTLRWLIERFHFVLKSGCRIEERRLGSVSALQRLLALANVVAWRLLYLTYAARIDPDLPCTVALQPVEWQALYGFIHKTQRIPISTPSLQQATLWIAKLGGFLARKGDGDPGLKVLWRGWQRLSDLVQTWIIFNPV